MIIWIAFRDFSFLSIGIHCSLTCLGTENPPRPYSLKLATPIVKFETLPRPPVPSIMVRLTSPSFSREEATRRVAPAAAPGLLLCSCLLCVRMREKETQELRSAGEERKDDPRSQSKRERREEQLLKEKSPLFRQRAKQEAQTGKCNKLDSFSRLPVLKSFLHFIG